MPANPNNIKRLPETEWHGDFQQFRGPALAPDDPRSSRAFAAAGPRTYPLLPRRKTTSRINASKPSSNSESGTVDDFPTSHPRRAAQFPRHVHEPSRMDVVALALVMPSGRMTPQTNP
jgi:hypothetical protein